VGPVTAAVEVRADFAGDRAGRSGFVGARAGLLPVCALKARHDLLVRPMKRLAEWTFYAIGVVAVLYLALYAYASFTGRDFRPGDPIHIFRSPDAPDYS
jgi:hypothetical protein